MTLELIGLPISSAIEKLKEAGTEYRVIENCDSLDGYDTTLVTALRETDGMITLITSKFKCEI